jgi:hypothetical protein
LTSGLFATDALTPRGANPLARCGYQDFAAVESIFAMAQPKGGGDA